jgi:hypothetical protein
VENDNYAVILYNSEQVYILRGAQCAGCILREEETGCGVRWLFNVHKNTSSYFGLLFVSLKIYYHLDK